MSRLYTFGIAVAATAVSAYSISSMIFGEDEEEKSGQIIKNKKDEKGNLYPPIIKGDKVNGCSELMRTNMRGFLEDCQLKYGNIFTLIMEENKHMTFIFDNSALKKLLYNKHSDFNGISLKSKKRFGLKEIVTEKGIIKLSDVLHSVLMSHESTSLLFNLIIKETFRIFNGMNKKYNIITHLLKNQTPSGRKNSKEIKLNQIKENNSVDWMQDDETLYFWIKRIIFQVEISVIFGNNFSEDKELYHLFNNFESSVPLRFAGKEESIAESFLNKMIKKINLIISKEKKHSFFVENILKFGEKTGLSKVEITKILVMLLWASLSNTTNTIFWVVIHFLHLAKKNQDSILSEIRKSDHLFKNESENNDKLNIHKMFPLLNSLIKEVFRFYGQTNIYRILQKDNILKLNGTKYRLNKGDWIGTNISFLHFNKHYFNDPYTFEFDRFFKNPQKSKHLLTFGSRCVGRYFAQNMVAVVVSFILYNYDFRLSDINKEVKTNSLNNLLNNTSTASNNNNNNNNNTESKSDVPDAVVNDVNDDDDDDDDFLNSMADELILEQSAGVTIRPDRSNQVFSIPPVNMNDDPVFWFKFRNN